MSAVERVEAWLVGWPALTRVEIGRGVPAGVTVKDLREVVAAARSTLHPALQERPDGGSIHELELGVRASNCLERVGIKTIGQLARMTEAQLMALPGFNVLCLTDVRMELQRFGLDISGLKKPRSKKGKKR